MSGEKCVQFLCCPVQHAVTCTDKSSTKYVRNRRLILLFVISIARECCIVRGVCPVVISWFYGSRWICVYYSVHSAFFCDVKVGSNGTNFAAAVVWCYALAVQL